MISEATRKKMSDTAKRNGNKPPSKLGWKPSEETKRKWSLYRKGKKFRLGTKWSEETRKKMLGRFAKEKNPNWMGGVKPNPYPSQFNRELKLKIRTRDNFTCCLCGRTEREELEELNYVLCVNHIDFNKNNCSESNLNTLCRRCNIRINRDRDYWTNYFNVL